MSSKVRLLLLCPDNTLLNGSRVIAALCKMVQRNVYNLQLPEGWLHLKTQDKLKFLAQSMPKGYELIILREPKWTRRKKSIYQRVVRGEISLKSIFMKKVPDRKETEVIFRDTGPTDSVVAPVPSRWADPESFPPRQTGIGHTVALFDNAVVQELQALNDLDNARRARERNELLDRTLQPANQQTRMRVTRTGRLVVDTRPPRRIPSPRRNRPQGV